jgi:hypothetical protein
MRSRTDTSSVASSRDRPVTIPFANASILLPADEALQLLSMEAVLDVAFVLQ